MENVASASVGESTGALVEIFCTAGGHCRAEGGVGNASPVTTTVTIASVTI